MFVKLYQQFLLICSRNSDLYGTLFSKEESRCVEFVYFLRILLFIIYVYEAKQGYIMSLSYVHLCVLYL